MAEIEIEKKSSPIWPWILLIILVIAGLIWYFSTNGDNIDPTEENQNQEQYQDTLEYENDLNDNNNIDR